MLGGWGQDQEEEGAPAARHNPPPRPQTGNYNWLQLLEEDGSVLVVTLLDRFQHFLHQTSELADNPRIFHSFIRDVIAVYPSLVRDSSETTLRRRFREGFQSWINQFNDSRRRNVRSYNIFSTNPSVSNQVKNILNRIQQQSGRLLISREDAPAEEPGAAASQELGPGLATQPMAVGRGRQPSAASLRRASQAAGSQARDLSRNNLSHRLPSNRQEDEEILRQHMRGERYLFSFSCLMLNGCIV